MLVKTEKGRLELRPGHRSLGQRERALLLVADGQQSESQLAALFSGEGRRLLNQLIDQGYLARQAPGRSDPDARTAGTGKTPHGEHFAGTRSLASARMFLFDLSERACSLRATRHWPPATAKPCAKRVTHRPCFRSAAPSSQMSRRWPALIAPTASVHAWPSCCPSNCSTRRLDRRPAPASGTLAPTSGECSPEEPPKAQATGNGPERSGKRTGSHRSRQRCPPLERGACHRRPPKEQVRHRPRESLR